MISRTNFDIIGLLKNMYVLAQIIVIVKYLFCGQRIAHLYFKNDKVEKVKIRQLVIKYFGYGILS